MLPAHSCHPVPVAIRTVPPVRQANVPRRAAARPNTSSTRTAHHAQVTFKRGFFTIIPEYSGAVRLRFGRAQVDAEGNYLPLKPGIRLNIPIVHDIYQVDKRLMPIEMKPQEVITADQVNITVDTVVWYQVFDPVRAVMRNRNIQGSVVDLAQGAVAAVLGHHNSGKILNERDAFNDQILQQIDRDPNDPNNPKAWGVKITRVNMRDVKFPESIVRAMAKKAEAEVAGQAKVTHAHYEKRAAEVLVEAGEILGKSAAAMDLRKLQTYHEMSKEKGTNTLLIPTEVLNVWKGKVGDKV